MRLLLRPQARFPLAWQLQREGVPLGDAFQFASGLYFRGKRAYAERFARPPRGIPGGLVITPADGLVDVHRTITSADLLRWAQVDIHEDNPRFTAPLLETSRALKRSARTLEVVLLGSIASGKYTEVLLDLFGERLLFPTEFVGRGDMSRGGLMLRCAAAGIELDYAPVLGAVRRGQRPPRLPPMRWTRENQPASKEG